MDTGAGQVRWWQPSRQTGVSLGTRRMGGVTRAVTAVVATAAMASGCTTGGSASPGAPRIAATQPSGPSMTPIVGAAECVTHRDLGRGGDAILAFKDLVAPGVPRRIDLNDEFTPGPAASDNACSFTLPNPNDLWCGQAAPWASSDMKNLVNASGAERVRRVGITVDEAPGKETGSSLSRSVAYVEFELPAQDPKRMGQYVQRAFENCAGGASQIIHGVLAVVGSVPGPGGESPAVAFRTRDRVAWVILSGREWTGTEYDRALKAVAAHLS